MPLAPANHLVPGRAGHLTTKPARLTSFDKGYLESTPGHFRVIRWLIRSIVLVSSIFNPRMRATKKIIAETICALLVILFIYTGLNKLLDYDSFSFQLGRSPYLQNFSRPVALLLPPAELLVALALIIKRTRLAGFYASFFLMSLFTGYVAIMLSLSYYLPCSCGGILQALSWQEHLVVNSAFTLLAAAGALLQNRIPMRNHR